MSNDRKQEAERLPGVSTDVNPQPNDRDLILEVIHDLDRRVLQAQADGYPQGRDIERRQSAALRGLLERADDHLGWQVKASQRSETPVMAITQNLTPKLRAAIAKALGQATAGDTECRSFCIGLLSRAVSDLIEGRIQLPEPSDRERRGLRMIRTGNVTIASDAEAADRWIDRVLAATKEP